MPDLSPIPLPAVPGKGVESSGLPKLECWGKDGYRILKEGDQI